MRLTPKQKIDIDLCRFFYPCNPTDGQIQEYLDLSERGIGEIRGKFSNNPLIIGKSRRGMYLTGTTDETGKRKLGLWEEAVLEGTIPYFTLLGGYEGTIIRKWWNPIRYIKGKFEFYHKPIPRFVVDFMKKEMFKGIDAEIIENCYQGLLAETRRWYIPTL